MARPTSGLRCGLVGIVAFLVSAAGFLQIRVGGAADFSAGSGGILGQLVGNSLYRGFGPVGANLFLVSLLLISTTLATGMSWLTVMDSIGGWVLSIPPLFRRGQQQAPNGSRRAPSAKSAKRRARSKPNCGAKRAPVKIEPPPAPVVEKSDRAKRETQIPLFHTGDGTGIPPLALLDDPKPQVKGYSEEDARNAFAPDRIQAQGFPHRCAGGRRLSGPGDHALRTRARAGRQGQPDLLARQGHRARPVGEVGARGRRHSRQVGGRPGNAEHHARDDLPLRTAALEGIRQVGSPLTLALGKDIAGRPTVADLARMPHLLVAGTTGSGKSVAVNAMVLSLLYKASAKDVRMLMIDPKMLELSVYQGIPHLLAPVVTDMKEAANGLRWCVAEMERRYKLMSTVGVRNLAGFNKKVKDAIDAGQPMMDPLFKPNPELGEAPRPLEPLPYIVVFIDEFADMMMIVGKKVEELIARLAQKARAAGIHLILATQRPSVGRHHRPDQGEHPHAHRVPGVEQDRLAHHPRPVGRGNAARPRRHAVPAAGHGDARARARRVRVGRGSASRRRTPQADQRRARLHRRRARRSADTRRRRGGRRDRPAGIGRRGRGRIRPAVRRGRSASSPRRGVRRFRACNGD
jgi:S-DNA-T family DNA segregation ATPase FtsK/SpoIIIE